MTTTRNRPAAVRTTLDEHAAMLARVTAYETLLDTVWRCERFEREHPLTVATIRSLAPRTVRP